MISSEDAQALIDTNVPAARARERVPALQALGSVLAADVKASIALPPFDNSAMDGFALRAADSASASAETPVRLPLVQSVRAGDNPAPLKVGQACRILTGARMPEGADCVLPVESAVVESEFLVLCDPAVDGRNLRRAGEEVSGGATLLSEGDTVTPATVGILASVGVEHVWVYKKPRVSLIATGNELVTPGRPLLAGKIYDSNTAMLQAALHQLKVPPVWIRRIGDDRRKITAVVRYALQSSDIVILTGGVSMGDADYVKPVLKDLGVKKIFWKVSQKPGKPLFFGKRGKTLVFGLPGNPAAVFTCFYEYVYPAIRGFMGHRSPHLSSELARLAENVPADPEKALFLKAKIRRTETEAIVTPLGRQASHMISSLQQATALLFVPHGKPAQKGQPAIIHALPYAMEVG